MHINIQAKNIELSDHLHKRIEKRLRHIYRHLSRDIKKITLRIHNESTAGGGITSCCQIQIQTRCLPVIYAEQKSNDIYSAILAAASRAQLNASRRLGKFNRLLAQLRKLKKQKTRYKTLRLFKHQENFIGGLS